MIDLTESDFDELLAHLNAGRRIPLGINASRRQALTDYNDVQACAGSGKTTLVGLKLLALARKWTAARQGICVLTHTNVARDEILKCLALHPAGDRLRRYPHFVGTIQEFVNTFLALPSLRSRGAKIDRIDDDYCKDYLQEKAGYGTKKYLQNRRKSVDGLRYRWLNNKVVLEVPGFDKVSDSPSYVDLVKIRTDLRKAGGYFYSEMYAFGAEALFLSPGLDASLRHRFPIVMIDEMQDVQGFQDDLISGIFRHTDVRYQRFGDPDQAIFDGMGDETPNSSYNSAALVPIVESHRYCGGIAAQLRGWSSGKLMLTASRDSELKVAPYSLILYSDRTRSEVLEKFGEHVMRLPEEKRVVVKAVGGVAQNSTDSKDPLNLRSYWSDFSRKEGNGIASAKSLCSAIRFMRSGEPGNRGFHVVLEAVAKLYALANVNFSDKRGQSKKPTRSGVIPYLRGLGCEKEFRQVLAGCLIASELSAVEWPTMVDELLDVLGLSSEKIRNPTFIAYDTETMKFDDSNDGGTMYRARNGLEISIDTIHSVKGETHDATLLLETKFRQLFDMKEMLPFLLDDALKSPVFDPAHPLTNESIRSAFMKRAYVAASRPRHFLCISMNRKHLSADEKILLRGSGWDIFDLG